MERRKLLKAWETLNVMPMPAIESDRLIELHNDLTHYDTTISNEMTDFFADQPVNLRSFVVDEELEANLRSFKPQGPEEVECRREMLKYKRKVDEVIREFTGILECEAQPT